MEYGFCDDSCLQRLLMLSVYIFYCIHVLCSNVNFRMVSVVCCIHAFEFLPLNSPLPPAAVSSESFFSLLQLALKACARWKEQFAVGHMKLLRPITFRQRESFRLYVSISGGSFHSGSVWPTWDFSFAITITATLKFVIHCVPIPNKHTLARSLVVWPRRQSSEHTFQIRFVCSVNTVSRHFCKLLME